MEKMYEVRLVRKQVLDTRKVTASTIEEAEKRAEDNFYRRDLNDADGMEVYCDECQCLASKCECDE